MDATLIIKGAGGTIVQQEFTQGVAISPNLPNGGQRVMMLVSEEDAAKLNKHKAPFYVTDLVTGFRHRLQQADCGLGCRCAVEFC